MEGPNLTLTYEEKVNRQYRKSIRLLLSKLPSYCRNFERYLQSTRSVHTCMQYLRDILLFYTFLSEQNPLIPIIGIRNVSLSILSELTESDFLLYRTWLFHSDEESCKEEKKKSGNKRRIIALRTFFSYLEEKGKIAENKTKILSLPRIKKRDISESRILSVEEFDKFFHQLSDAYLYAKQRCDQASKTDLEKTPYISIRPAMIRRDQVISRLLAETGLHVSTICAMDISHVNLNDHTITIAKKEEKSTIRISLETTTMLDNYIHNARTQFEPTPTNHDALFIGSKRTRITVRSVERMIQNYSTLALGAENSFTPRDLRTSVIAKLYFETKKGILA